MRIVLGCPQKFEVVLRPLRPFMRCGEEGWVVAGITDAVGCYAYLINNMAHIYSIPFFCSSTTSLRRQDILLVAHQRVQIIFCKYHENQAGTLGFGKDDEGYSLPVSLVNELPSRTRCFASDGLHGDRLLLAFCMALRRVLEVSYGYQVAHHRWSVLNNA